MPSIRSLLSSFRGNGHDPRVPPAEPDLAKYLASSYPHNHSYRLRGRELVPDRQLLARSRAITALYPQPLTSLLDLSCCKGYFVFEAAARQTCERAMGIDVFEQDVEVCRRVERHIGSERTRFECMTLEQTAARIDELGGPFQTALLINTYQYLYFGSPRGPGYLNHDVIFEHLARACGRCVVFSNRVEREHCQNVEQVEAAGAAAADYNTASLIRSASQRFTVFPLSAIGRYPLWLLVKR